MVSSCTVPQAPGWRFIPPCFGVLEVVGFCVSLTCWSVGLRGLGWEGSPPALHGRASLVQDRLVGSVVGRAARPGGHPKTKHQF